jgi:uncharacterized protein (TIGR03437 family)
MAISSLSRKTLLVLSLLVCLVSGLLTFGWLAQPSASAAVQQRSKKKRAAMHQLQERRGQERQAQPAAQGGRAAAPGTDRDALQGPLLSQNEAGSRNRPSRFAMFEYKSEAFTSPPLYDAPRQAAAFFKQKRMPEGAQELPLEKYLEAREQMQKMRVYSTARAEYLTGGSAAAAPLIKRANTPDQSAWAPLGPGNIGGRTRALLIDPQNPQVMYAAGVAGGVWKTTNGGQAWAPISDQLANLAVSCLAFDPKNSQTIYAGTGEGFFNIDSVRGAGIFKTTDGGQTWASLSGTGGQEFYFVNDFVVSPANSQRLYAGTSQGVFRSLDGGTSWQRVHNPLNEDGDTLFGGCLDLAIRTDKLEADVVFAACGTFEQSAVFRTINGAGDEPWTNVLSDSGMGRTALALAPSNQDIIYAISTSIESGPYQDALHAVFRSTSGGDLNSWTPQVRNTDGTKLNTAILSLATFAQATNCGTYIEDDFIGQGWYDLTIAVDPVDSNRVWVGGIDLFRSDDGGANWGLATQAYQARENPQYAHPDQHVIVFHPQYDGVANQILFAGNDGGLWRTNNARAAVALGNTAACKSSNTAVTWTSLNNGYGVTQFYHGSVLPDGKSFFGGTQDNGTLLGDDQQGGNAWREINGGDGGYTAVDTANPATLFVSYTGISMFKSTDGGATFSSALLGLTDPGGLFITPYVMDTSDASRLWTGGAYLWRTTNGASLWTRASSLTAGSGFVSGLAVAPTDANYLLAGMSDGYLLRTTVGLTATSTTVWAATQPRRGYVSSVAFDPANKNIAYATYATFGGSHVWRSTDGGSSWMAIDGSGPGALPDVPVHSIAIDPANTARMYIGTDVGIFVTTDGGNAWAVESTGFPNVITESLSLNVVNGETWLYAFTHGRGAWRVKVNNSGCNFAISPATVNVGVDGQTGVINVQAQPNGCNWTAASNASWLQINGAGSSSGTVEFIASPNTSTSARAATATIAGRSLVITQPGMVDLIPPTVAVTEPNPATTANDLLGAITVRGTAADNGTLADITWSNDRGGGGTATGTANWTINGLTLAAGFNTITITARDTANNLARVSFTVNSRPASLILTLVGNGLGTASGDGELATLAQIGLPSSVTFDLQGNLYIADTLNDRIRKVNASDGKISTVAGGAGNGYAGDGGPATAARLNCPTGVNVDAQGNLYIADRDNHRIRRVAAADGLITTFAGTGTAGFSGDNSEAVNARLNQPTNTVFDTQGNLFIADSLNHRIRKVATDGKITTVAGIGTNGAAGDDGPATSAQLNLPVGLALDAQSNLYIADTNNSKLRRVSAETGTITTVAGTGTRGSTGDGGPARAAQLAWPEGVWVDAQNTIIIADTFNDRVRRINASDGRISTIAGNGLTGYTGDGTSATSTRMFCPTSVVTDMAGRLYIADRENNRIRVVQPVPTGDLTPPVVTLTAPTTGTTLTTTASPLMLAGTAQDANGIVQVRWQNDRGFAGTAAGTNVWTVASVPLLIGLNNVTVTAFDLGGNSTSVTLAVTFNPAQVVVTVAGNGTVGSLGDGGAAVAAQLRQPIGVAVDGQGNLYVADTYNHRVRKVSPSGVITPFAGNGILGSSGDNGLATAASLNEPISVLADSAGNVYIGDYRNHRVRKVTPDGQITTIAGTGEFGDKGDGGPATQAEITFPIGLALDAQGNLFIAEDWSPSEGGNNRVRKVNASDGKISTVAGNGEVGFGGDGGPATQARFLFPTGLAVDRQGNLYIADYGNARIRRVNASDGVINTIAGTGTDGYNGDNIPANTAQLNGPWGLGLDGAGDLLIADQVNSRLRKITLSTGMISTIAGNGNIGYGGDNGAPNVATLGIPTNVAVDGQGHLYFADGGNHRVRKIQPATTIRTVATISAASFTPNLAADAIAAAFGTNLATTTQAATTLPLPVTLAGANVRVRDSQGVERFAPLFFVSPEQLNYLIPVGTANGLATITVNTTDGSLITGTVMVSSIAPALFSANADGQGVPAAVALRVRSNGEQVIETIAAFDATSNRMVATSIDLGQEGEQVFLILFGSGLRNRIPNGTVTVTLGGEAAEVVFAGAQGELAGLDQLNVKLPRGLAGRGDVDLLTTVDGKAANLLRINVK